mgnify:CR=1 FL=1
MCVRQAQACVAGSEDTQVRQAHLLRGHLLEGLETTWHETTERVAQYQRLPPGDYRLRVELGTESGVGDINRDCSIDIQDYNILASRFRSTDQSADLNLDGIVDEADIAIFQANAYNLTCASTASAPTTRQK